jgi:hypothetical protein
LHSDAAATNRLEGTTYFQGRRAVDDYLDDFRDLISDSGYSDPKTIVVKFRRGLNPAIADAVATMAAGRPDDLDPEAWYEAARRIDQNQAANAAFRSAHHVASQPKPLMAATTTRFQPTVDTRAIALPNRQVFLSRFAHTSPTPGNPVPMDIDATRRTNGRCSPSSASLISTVGSSKTSPTMLALSSISLGTTRNGNGTHPKLPPSGS